MGQRTIYVRDEHEPLWERAKELVGDGESLSSLIAEGLQAVIAQRERLAAFARIEVTYQYQNIPISKAFRGRRLFEAAGYPDPDRTTQRRWHAALTARGNYVIWTNNNVTPEGVPTDDVWWVGPTLADAPANIPQEIIGAAAGHVNPGWLPELDL